MLFRKRKPLPASPERRGDLRKPPLAPPERSWHYPIIMVILAYRSWQCYVRYDIIISTKMELRMDNDFLSKQILKILKHFIWILSKPQRKNIADIIVALFFNTSFSLREIASRMPGDSNVKHKLKRLVYSLDTLTINRTFFKSYIKTLFALPNFRFRKRDYITILLDTTTLRDDFLILSASISYKGRAIPVY